MFWRLPIGTIMMLDFGFAGWAYILYDIFQGEARSVAGICSEAVKDAFSYMRIMVPGGWHILLDTTMATCSDQWARLC